ncbi:MAG: cell envelope integrity protein TolA [Patescibacteria group bacterium]
MQNYTPLNIGSKKKGKFFLAANILLMILVVGITGFYLSGRLITTQEKAGFDCSDWSDKKKCQAERKEYEESGQADADKEAKKKAEREAKRMKEEEYVPSGGCPGGYVSCDLNDAHGSRHKFCISNDGSEGGCNSGAVSRGIDVQIGGGGEGTGAWRCVPGVNNYTSGSCDSRNYAEVLKGCTVPKCFCGIIQIDHCDGINATYQSTCGCNKEEEQLITQVNIPVTIIPTPTSEVTPTEQPTPTEALTPTEIPTSTPTETPTLTPTGTPGPTATPTPTGTPGPTDTPTPTKVASLPSSGQASPIIFAIPIGIIILGLLL